MFVVWIVAQGAIAAEGSFAFEVPVVSDDFGVFGEDPKMWQATLTREARAAGLPVVGFEDPLFGVDGSDDATWRVGAEIVVTCFPLNGYLRTGRMRCLADARWEVIDAATGALQLSARSSSDAERDVGEPPGKLGGDLLRGLASGLLGQGAFRTAVKGVAPAPASVPLRPCLAAAASLPGGASSILAAGFTSLGGQPGLILSPDGLGLLPAEAVGRATSIQVRLPEGIELPAEVLRRDPSLGLALVDVAGSGHRCRPPALELNPVPAYLFTATAGGQLVLVPSAGADEPGNLALTATGTVAGAADVAWPELAKTLGIGVGPTPAPSPDPEGPVPEAPEALVARATAPLWSTAERRTTRGLLGATATFLAGGVATWAAGQGAEPPVTGAPLVVVNTHLWAGALALGAVTGVQIAGAARTP